ncbi:single-stranded DNA-binding protein [Paenarthrobacter sp. NPDC056912]|uniref:single-stranded DNA-binding protein n=1 Tax=Paenarthrobacter sp. NPDC056912 TaxID=3345965 RepID=UPI00366CC208
MAEKKIIYGDVVSDVTIKQGENGLEASFQLVSERLRMSEGRWVSDGKDHRWVNVTGKQAEIARDHWGKGAAVAVYGNIHGYEDKGNVQRERIYADAVFPRLTDEQWQLERISRTHERAEPSVTEALAEREEPLPSSFDREQEAAKALRFAAGMRAAGVGAKDREHHEQGQGDDLKLDVRRHLDVLRLDVKGHEPESNNLRYERARDVVMDFDRRSDRAYAAAGPFSEPYLEQPLGAQLLVKHLGDIAKVAADARFEDYVAKELGLSPYEQKQWNGDEEQTGRVFPADTAEGRERIQEVTAGIRQSLDEELQAGIRSREVNVPPQPGRSPAPSFHHGR